MLSTPFSRRIAVAVAGVALLSTTAACGGSSSTALCAEASQLMRGYASSMVANISAPEKFNEENQKFAKDLKALAAKADGDLASALNGLASTFETFDLDANDPAAAAAAATDLGEKITDATTKFGTACS
ncbi:hypothetical protein [Streptosporangium sp. NPDC087985]|uniref:hypothetical protein n=1 Tax=Streptosporangium sp. NPDC087985 TaxID=3366196 RepID=UPI0037F4386E